MTTAYKPRVPISRTRRVEEAAASRLAHALGVDVHVDNSIPREQCEWCGNAGAVTTNRVTAVPNPHETREGFIHECCHHCVKSVVDSAKEIHWDRAGRDVLVEVAL